MHKKLVKKIDAGARELDSMREIAKVCDIKVNIMFVCVRWVQIACKHLCFTLT